MKNSNNGKYRGHGEGSIFQLPNGKWRAMYILPGGKRVSKVGSSKADCHKWLKELMLDDHPPVESAQVFAPVPGSQEIRAAQESQVDEETRPQSSPQVEEISDPKQSQIVTAQHADSHQTLEEYLTSWFKTHQNMIKPTTQSDYRRIIYKYIIPGLGDHTLDTLRRSTFDGFYGDLLEQGMKKSYIIYIHRVLRKALEDAVDDRTLLYNPAANAKLPRVDKKNHRRSPLTVEETNRLVETAMQTPLGPLVFTAVKVGLRQGELFALQWEDIDWNQRQIHVRRNVQRVKMEIDSKAVLTFSSPKSASGNRIINIGSKTLDMFQEQMEIVTQLRVMAGDRWQEYHLVFPSSVGTPRNPSVFTKMFHKLLESAGVPKIKFHDLRHLAASIMLNNGVPSLVVSRILGHSSPSTTINLYGHEFTLQEIQAAELMDQIIPTPESAYKVDVVSIVINEP